jgi:formate hydrogenlyase transcriptional activator
MFARLHDSRAAVNGTVPHPPCTSALAAYSGFRLSIEDVPHGTLILGKPGVVLAANDAAETIFGYGPGQLIGQPIERLLPESSCDLHADPWNGFWTNPQNRRLGADQPLAGLRFDGKVVPLEMGLAVFVHAQIRYVIASLTDVAERLQAEARTTLRTNGIVGLDHLVADLSARFATREPDGIGDAIVDTLRQIAEFLQLDSAVLWWKYADQANGVVSHSWIREPQRLRPHPLDLLSSLPAACEVTSFTRVDEVPEPAVRDAFLQLGIRSAAVLPVPIEGADGGQGHLAFATTTERTWAPGIIEGLRLLSSAVGQALTRKTHVRALQRARDEICELRERLIADGVHRHSNMTMLSASRVRDSVHPDHAQPRDEAHPRPGAGAIIGQSLAIRRVLEQVKQVAATDSTVLLLGETGTGKELLATYVHELSARRGRAMVRVNCSAIPATLIESELFGRERGAFTGALAKQIGRFELADRSTIFLDEIGDLPGEVQVKLLRVLEERQFERLGSPKAIHVDVRIVAATHGDLEQRIVEHAFREDLFYRLNVFPIRVPALRDRAEDIPLLVWRFVDEFSKTFGKRIETIPRESLAALQRYAWPGNIRELRNVVERAMIVTTGPHLTIALPEPSLPAGRHSVIMADVEKEHIRSVLESTGWRIRGAGGAAERLGLRPTTLETRMAKLGLTRPTKS